MKQDSQTMAVPADKGIMSLDEIHELQQLRENYEVLKKSHEDQRVRLEQQSLIKSRLDEVITYNLKLKEQIKNLKARTGRRCKPCMLMSQAIQDGNDTLKLEARNMKHSCGDF